MGSDSARAFSEDGPVAAALTPYGMAQAAQQLPAYWGEQPYTGGPTYLGAAALFLALLGALLVGGRDRWGVPRSRKLRAPEPLERQRRQQRHRPLHDHEGHRDRAELVVAGKVFIGQFGQSHEVMPPRQQQHDSRAGCACSSPWRAASSSISAARPPWSR